MPRLIMANEIADHYGLNQKTYRQAIRDQAPHDPRYRGIRIARGGLLKKAVQRS